LSYFLRGTSVDEDEGFEDEGFGLNATRPSTHTKVNRMHWQSIRSAAMV